MENTTKEMARHEVSVRAELLDNCQIMQSRVRAILNCDEAIDALCADDCFGPQYAELLAPL